MAIDRCTETRPHPAHRTQYGPFGVKDCPGVPITPANAPDVPDGPAPGSGFRPGGVVAGPPLTILLFPDECVYAARENRVTCVRADHDHGARDVRICTCPLLDVTTVGQPPGSEWLRGLDPRCPLHGSRPATEG